MLLLILAGWAKLLFYDAGPVPTAEPSSPVQELTIFLTLRAFASGCTALTGIEAISNGVPSFQPPESRNASITLVWMAATLLVMFTGITSLASIYHILPHEGETVVSQLGRQVFGGGPFYYLVQAATTMILVLAANTSFADFPRLASIMARDRFLPRQFRNLGDRLVFSNGIIALGLLASLLIIWFDGQTHALIPLYAVGVFLSFTLSQSGMVMRWRRRRGKGWALRAAVNGIGALTTGVVLCVFATVKFTQGAWMVVVLIPALVLFLVRIHRHYEFMAAEITLSRFERLRPMRHIALVPAANLNRGLALALEYARSIGHEVRAIHVSLNPETTQRMLQVWQQWYPEIPLVVLESPYRSILDPLLTYISRVKEGENLDVVTVILPEIVTPHWWQELLHNQTALLIKGALFFKKGVVVATVRYHLKV